MQVDFHHAVTYVAARLAGFDHKEGSTVAYAAQYVDDATNGGVTHFDSGELYSRISSAHRALDYRNFNVLANHRVWIPFHFLPGNGGKRADETGPAKFIDKIVCKPGSPVAIDMVNACIEGQSEPEALHRLGITMHVYADTWAHQDFAGVTDDINDVRIVDREGKLHKGFMNKLKNYFKEKFNRAASEFVGGVKPLGHGAALSWPDLPYLQWAYRREGQPYVERDNTEEFVTAADAMCKAMRCYRAGVSSVGMAELPGLPDGDKALIREMFATIEKPEPEERHKDWLAAINGGTFSFSMDGGEVLEYPEKGKGKGSWKYDALGITRSVEYKNDVFHYSDTFLGTDWKQFHDALQTHRLVILRDILPRYGICAA